MNEFITLLSQQSGAILIGTITIAIPLLITALGGLFSEKSGVINIGLEGMMVFGAFFGAMIMPSLVQMGLNWIFVIIIGLIAGIFGAMLLGLLHAFLSIKMGVNQIISGTAINMLAPAFSFFIIKLQYNTFQTPRINLNVANVPLMAGANISIDKLFVIALIVILFIISAFIFKKTKFGRHIIAVGQNPQASATSGINVNKIRFISVLISSAFAGLGGICMVILISGQLTISLISGYGFLALAILIFSGWNPIKCLMGSLLFAFFIGLVPSLNTIINTINLSGLNMDANSIKGILRICLDTGPYIIAIIFLMVFSRNNKAPKALGTNYNKEQR